MSTKNIASYEQLKHCSFCGKNEHEVRDLIAGAKGFICDECIERCFDIIHEDEEGTISAVLKADLSPIKTIRVLNDYAVGQYAAKRGISVAIYEWLKMLEHNDNLAEGEDPLDKQNVLLYGPSGSGKTFLVELVSKLADIPYAKIDAANITESGFAGSDVTDALKLLITKAGSVERAERGIIYLDEIDKKISKIASNSSGRDISGSGAQQAIISMIEGTDILVTLGKGPAAEEVTINTRNILFILGGSFVNGTENLLADVTKERLRKEIGFEKQGITFTATEQVEGKVNVDKMALNEILSEVLPVDLIKVGLIPELVGRCPRIFGFLALTRDELVTILSTIRNSQVIQYKKRFAMEGIDLDFSLSALNAIADKAGISTGARALKEIMPALLNQLEIDIHEPENANVCRIEITKAFVLGNKEAVLIRGKRKTFEYTPLSKIKKDTNEKDDGPWTVEES